MAIVRAQPIRSPSRSRDHSPGFTSTKPIDFLRGATSFRWHHASRSRAPHRASSTSRQDLSLAASPASCSPSQVLAVALSQGADTRYAHVLESCRESRAPALSQLRERRGAGVRLPASPGDRSAARLRLRTRGSTAGATSISDAFSDTAHYAGMELATRHLGLGQCARRLRLRVQGRVHARVRDGEARPRAAAPGAVGARAARLLPAGQARHRLLRELPPRRRTRAVGANAPFAERHLGAVRSAAASGRISPPAGQASSWSTPRVIP